MSESGTDHRAGDVVSGKRSCEVMPEKMGTFPILFPLSDGCGFIQPAGIIANCSCTDGFTGGGVRIEISFWNHFADVPWLYNHRGHFQCVQLTEGQFHFQFSSEIS